MNTLLEMLPRIEALGGSEAVRFSNGIRTWTYAYRDLYRQICQFAHYLDAEGFQRGDRLLLWSENRPEWIAIFWACLARGVQVVPIDSHSSTDRVTGIYSEAGARLLVTGSRKPPGGTQLQAFAIEALSDLAVPEEFSAAPAVADDVVEVLYTSGTTAEPKGVVHRHRNICANLTPIASEIGRYKRWARPFRPIRFLNLLPLSHMFGQSMGVFLPVLLEGSVVFMTDLHPAAIRQTIRRERVSVLVSVPRMLESLASEVQRRHPVTATPGLPSAGVIRRWWRYRALHADLGWKFWAFVVGGAELDADVEAFWGRVGLLIVQGYGLTETSPVVAVNHPFHAKRGTLGRAVGDQEVRIGEDGEILVRGASVVDEYLEAGSVARPATDKEGWFHTGDIGALDSEGRLTFRGRKKDVIVTADGLNVYPEDVEHVLHQIPGVAESVVVSRRGPHGERPHAVLIVRGEQDPATLVQLANQRLEPEQRIQTWSLWHEHEFPRTTSTQKVQRRLVAAHVGREEVPDSRPGRGEGVVEELVGLTGRPAAELREAGDLGLSSLERVDLLAGLEHRYGIELDEEEFSEISTLDELRNRVEDSLARSQAWSESRHRPGETAPVRVARRASSPPRWAQSSLVRAFRATIQAILIRPLLRYFVEVSVEGLENLEALPPPVLFASNHASHMDAPVVLAALPAPWRGRVAPAVRQEYFFAPRPTVSRIRSWVLRVEYFLTCAVFNAYPLPQQLGQVREALRYTGELVSSGTSPLVFPEGRLSRDGNLQTFRPGIGFMAERLGLPVVPLYVKGIFEVLPVGARWPVRGPVRLKIGKPVAPGKDEGFVAYTARLEAVLRSFEAGYRSQKQRGGD